MVQAVVGANWGDEGKGKITDMLAEKADIIVRFQGGANAGHTIVNNYGKFALHTLPSGVFYDHTTSIIGNGVALNIPVLFNEVKSITDKGVPMPKILVSDRAQMVMPYHVLFDAYEEERLAGKSFGSTKSGIAPFYSDKYAKIGFQVSELFDDEAALRDKIERVIASKNSNTVASTRHLPSQLTLFSRFVTQPGTIFEPVRLLTTFLPSFSSISVSMFDTVVLPFVPVTQIQSGAFGACAMKSGQIFLATTPGVCVPLRPERRMMTLLNFAAMTAI